uniref:N-acetyltransferase domain-containing protein n=1 Tax=Arion vulgaris TaxID=1028688 RepID=A0A0B6YA10_9EUPU
MLQSELKKLSSMVVPCCLNMADGRRVLVDTMTESQIHEMYLLVHEAAQTGQGFGADEYENEKEFIEEVSDGFQYAVMDKDSGQMIAAFILAISKYSRGCLVADPFILVNKSQRGCRLGSLCMNLCVQFAKDLGFMGIYCDTFSNNTAMIKIIENIPGFQKVGCLPMGGVLKDGVLVGTDIYYKDLRPTSIEG